MPTIKQVADLAGVSVGTVSHVITGSVKVSEPLRIKVDEAIRQLDYHPNHVARSLKTSRTHTLGIIVPDMTISFFPQVIRGAETAAREKGYSLIAVNSGDSAERQSDLLSLLRSQQVEGILLVLAAAAEPPAHQIARMISAGIRVICLDRVADKLPVDSVCVDDLAAAEMGVSHLIDAGYRRIAIVTGPSLLKNEQLRLRGYEKCLKHAGIASDPDLVWRGNLQIDDVASLCVEKLRTQPKPDAIFATNGQTALGALRALRDCGLKTPGDVGFAAFDELTVDDLFQPRITTIVQPSYDIGFHAAAVLLRRISDPTMSADPVAERLPAVLKIRDSSRGPHQ